MLSADCVIVVTRGHPLDLSRPGFRLGFQVRPSHISALSPLLLPGEAVQALLGHLRGSGHERSRCAAASALGAAMSIDASRFRSRSGGETGRLANGILYV